MIAPRRNRARFRAAWKARYASVFAAAVWGLGAQTCYAQAVQPPLVLERSMVIPDVPVGPYSDDIEIDLEGKRIFATPQAAQAVAVLDMNSGQMLKLIKGIGNPHGLFYNESQRRLFVVDGKAGDVKVFNGQDYSLVKSIPLNLGADGLIYDPRSQLLYISNGGRAAGMQHALLSIVDPARMEKIGDIAISTVALEGGDVDPDRELIYINMEKDDNAVAVVDLKTRLQKAVWKLPPGNHRGKGVALDTEHNRLYVASRDTDMHASIIVLDASNGRYITSLPIAGWVDGISVDEKLQRISASS